MTKLFDITVTKALKGFFGGCLAVMFLLSIGSLQVRAEETAKSADVKKVEIDKNVEKITSKIDDSHWYNTSGMQNNLEKLRNAANGEQVLKWGQFAQYNRPEGQYLNKFGVDSKMEDIFESVQSATKEALKNKQITNEQAQVIMLEARRLYEVGFENAKKAYAERGDEKRVERLEIAKNDTLSVENTSIEDCATIDQLRQKYQAGCWSCLVVEKLVSSFLNAASKAYEVSQRAALTLLAIGAVMWVLVWGLKNMSSLTQLEPGNILNEFLIFAFKILFAYVVIISGLKVLGSYIVNPIMGTGAVIAQQFWPENIKAETEDYKWDTLTDEDYAEVEKEVQKAIIDSQSITPISKTTEQTTVMKEYTPEERAKIAASLANSKGFTEEKIPNFLIPGTTTGRLSSPFGCRKSPTATASIAHLGIDIGTGGRPGPVVAAGPGIISYKTQIKKGEVAGAGHYAIIVHDKKWSTQYFHMTKSSLNFTSGQVAQGQQIGIIGNSGVGTGVHLHFEVIYNGKQVDPLSLTQGKIIVLNKSTCTGKNITPFPKGFEHSTPIPGSGWAAAGKGLFDLSSTYVTTGVGGSGGSYLGPDTSSLIIPSLGEIKYSGPTDILSSSVMNSILGATNVITNTMSETMILGDAITCFSTQKNGGAWNIGDNLATFWFDVYITNLWMWLEGAAIWCCGFMLTLAVAYYLLDICFKLGFAVIAFPIVMGLWPFNMTKGKLMICLSIIFKAAATFAFLAITTSYSMAMINSALGGEDGANGLMQMFEALEIRDNRNEANIRFVSARLDVFGSYFILLLFAFIYSFKLIGATINQFVNKFFSDQAFGDASPMHHMATATTKYLKDKAMAPVGLARDIALNKTGKALKSATLGTASLVMGKGKDGNAAGNATTKAGSATKATGGAVKATGQGVAAAGKGVQAAGKGVAAASSVAAAIPVVGTAVAAVGKGVGKGIEAAGKGIEAAGKGIKKTGEGIKKAGEAMKKAGKSINKIGAADKENKDDSKPKDKE